jgi:hypothetical protein
MSCPTKDFIIKQGSTWSKSVSWLGGGKICKLIEGLTPGCPTSVNITAHGIPDGSELPVFISHVKGATRANTETNRPVVATYIDVDNFFIDKDTVAQTYTSGTGLLTYFAPTDLTNYTARMQIRESRDSTTVIADLTSTAGDIVITSALGKVTVTITAAATALYDFDSAVYDIEVIDDSVEPVVTRIVEGEIELCKEVTK